MGFLDPCLFLVVREGGGVGPGSVDDIEPFVVGYVNAAGHGCRVEGWEQSDATYCKGAGRGSQGSTV